MQRRHSDLFLIGLTIALTQACAAPAPSPADPERLVVRILVLNYDPLTDGRPLHEALGWQDPRQLAASYVRDLTGASAGRVRFEMVEWRDRDAIPRKVDGFRYSVAEYERNHRSGAGWHDPDAVDYRVIFAAEKIPLDIDSGRIDEVWLFGGPYFGYSESAMAGPGAFYINGEVLADVAVLRPFAVMGFNYERGVAEMLENLCHRTEATMSRVYGGWRAEALDHNWARFAANEKQSGSAGVGSCHWPANAEREYDWENPRSVGSTADQWLRYPLLDGPLGRVNRESWGGPDYARNYFRWWFERLPKAPGVNADGRLNNWWRYIFDVGRFDEHGRPQR